MFIYVSENKFKIFEIFSKLNWKCKSIKLHDTLQLIKSDKVKLKFSNDTF